MKSLIIFTILTAIVTADNYKTQKRPPPNSYLCPANFVRTKHNKCYYFSRSPENFDKAYWACVAKHSTLAVIRGRNQDNTLRRLLNRNKIQHVERWIGARYNWERKKWQWAANGKLLNYTGFEDDPKDADGWQCIILDPKLRYKWNFRSCLEEKHFICQTRLKKTNVLSPANDRNATKFDKNLNEVIPEVANNDIPSSWILKDGKATNEEENAIGKISLAYSPKPNRRTKGNKRKGKGKKRKNNNKKANKEIQKDNETQQDAPVLKEGPPVPKKIKYVTYHGESAGPLHPRIIVEDFDFLKNDTSS